MVYFQNAEIIFFIFATRVSHCLLLISGECLVQAGNSFKCMEDIKFNMEDQVKREYIEPLRGIQSVELKEIHVSSHRPALKFFT